MVKKILFILIFALLLLIFLNSNSFCADFNILPDYFKDNISDTYKTYFNNSSQYFCFHNTYNSSDSYVLFFGSNFYFDISNGYYVICTSDYSDFYRIIFKSSSGSYLESRYRSSDNKPSFKISDTYYFVRSNFDVYDKNNNLLFASNPYPPLIVFYNISYNLNGGTGEGHTDTVQDGNSITLWNPENLTPPTNKEFIGWATTDSATSPDVTSPYFPTGDITLYAVYQTTAVFYTITYNLNGGIGSSHTDVVQAGNSVNLWSGSSFSPPEDKTFVGWSTSSTAASSDITSPYTPTGDITLYAVYEYNTSGIISGIRNLINSITSGFSNILSGIGNILSYLNPLSENFFGYKLIDLLKSALQFLFIPDSDNLNTKINSIKDKFSFIDSINNTINGLMEIVQDENNSSVFTINLGESKYFRGGNITVIDFSWYAPYKQYGDIIICCFVYVFFFWRIFIHLPSIINGSGGAVDNAIEISRKNK